MLAEGKPEELQRLAPALQDTRRVMLDTVLTASVAACLVLLLPMPFPRNINWDDF
ncbi:hypothetical protein [Tabrizicola sp.]|uniref:hypothetical protein n=1 Tax=Tabrizicola sp. TaxID=2005166 RepID=UPI0035B26D97